MARPFFKPEFAREGRGGLVYISGAPKASAVHGPSWIPFIFVVLIFGAIWLGGGLLKKTIDAKVSSLEVERRQLEGIAKSGEIADIASLNQRLAMLNGLIDDHANWEVFMREFLESVTLPSVQFTSLNADRKTGTVKLSGYTGTFTDLARQILALERNDLVKSVDSKGGSLSEERGVTFDLTLVMAQAAWQVRSPSPSSSPANSGATPNPSPLPNQGIPPVSQ